MAIINTGIVERTIVGVNESDLFLDSESTSVATNTGIVERSILGVNDSAIPVWKDSESTSTVNNTGVVERGVTGVNDSDPMFPDNTISNIVNIAGNLITALINAFKSRVSADGGTLDNEVGLNIDDLDETASLTMLPNAYKDGTLYSVLPENASGDFDVVRGSAATRVNAEGLIEDVATNIPRIDYTDGTASILLEPQSTNSTTHSEDFSNAAWAGGQTSATVTASTNTNPSGGNGTYLVENVAGTQLGAVVSVTAGLSYTGSFYVRRVSGSGAITLRNVNNVATAFTATSEWQRFSVTGVATGAGRLYINTLNTGDIIEVWGAQLEALSYATSYIPTSGAIATRLADVMSVDLTSFSLTSITETIDGVEQTPITSIPSTYTIPQGNINKIVMI